MNDKSRDELLKRFVSNSHYSEMQLVLLQYVEKEVGKYMPFDKELSEGRAFTTNLLFILVRLLGELYALNHDSENKV